LNFPDFMNSTFHRRCWSYRYYGNGKKRALRHRFEVKGGFTTLEVMADNISKSNPLFERLKNK